MGISRETIEKIRSAADVVEVISDFVQLKRRGATYLGLCPFHNEKSPSFNVNPVRGIYKCFGCGKAGDSISFMMEHDKMSYPEALRYLAEKYNIKVEEDRVTTDADKAAHNERESLYIALKWAKDHYVSRLNQHPDGQAIGLSYFRERGFSLPTIEAFELGYSLDKWDDLLLSGTKTGYSQDVMERAGLLVAKEDGKVFDRFRARVIFPIHNGSGRVIGFGARFLGKDKTQPKYLNSPESTVYHKGDVLYGLFQAKKSIRELDNVYLCEGYTDVISLYQAGVKNVVASSGTALTPEQIKLVSRHTKNITVLYDGDSAGIKASLRGIDLLLEGGMNVRAVAFPDGEDPDSYVRKIGNEAFIEYLTANSVDFIKFKASLFLDEARADPIRKTAIVRDIVGSITKVQDAILRSMYYTTSARLLDVDEQLLISEGNKIIQQEKARAQKEAQTKQRIEDRNQGRPSGTPPPSGTQSFGPPRANPDFPSLGTPPQQAPDWGPSSVPGLDLPPGVSLPPSTDGEASFSAPPAGFDPFYGSPLTDDIGGQGYAGAAYPDDDFASGLGDGLYMPPLPDAPAAEQPELASRSRRMVKLQGEYEKEVLRFLITHTDNGGEQAVELAQYFLHELHDVAFSNPMYERIYGFYCQELEEGRLPSMAYYMALEDRELANAVASLVGLNIEVSPNWKDKHLIVTPREEDDLQNAAFNTIARLKLIVLRAQVFEVHLQIQSATDDAVVDELLQQYSDLKAQEVVLGEEIGQVLSDFHIGRASK